MLGEVEQGLNLGLSAVELAEGRFELCRDVADELRLQGITFVSQLYVLLLTTGEQDEAHQDDGSYYQRCSQDTSQDKQAYNENPARGQRTVFIAASGP